MYVYVYIYIQSMILCVYPNGFHYVPLKCLVLDCQPRIYMDLQPPIEFLFFLMGEGLPILNTVSCYLSSSERRLAGFFFWVACQLGQRPLFSF